MYDYLTVYQESTSIKEMSQVSDFLGLPPDNKLQEEIADKISKMLDWKNKKPCMHRKC